MKKLFIPVIDNGMGLARSTWAIALAGACLGVLRRYDVVIQQISYPYPDGALNVATNDFLLSDCDEMLVIDTDVIFTDRQLAWLLSHDEPLVFGLYPKKQPGLTFPMEWLTEENPFVVNPLADGVWPLVEVKRVARGFMRVHRSVFHQLSKHVSSYVDAQTGETCKEFWRSLPGGHSEDFAFCDSWRNLGGKILIDQRCVAQHEGTAVYPIKGTF